MIFNKTSFKGLYLINTSPFVDERGEFSRIFCSREFKKKKLRNIVQANHSVNKYKHTLRGLDFQIGKYAEDKIVYGIKGKIWDCVVDLRKKSNTFGKYFGIYLSENDNQLLYVPRGFAHGFLTLKNNTEVIYFSTNFYKNDHERGVRWNDKKFQIKWPKKPKIISQKDKNYLDYN